MYSVTLPREFPYEQRVRAGIVVNKVYGFEGELTDEQLEAIKADGVLSVTKVQAPASKSESKDSGNKPK
ncbi:hypothetical protein NG701_07485 [Pseudarthrobacter sp. HLT3-5]|uniref:hypothetical protein n=1 Tax=Pseudarthrobacter cellobiosi TaxID=2953654 RepID=UPI00208DF470|nr:hypothetical protein [Pseudarthrobacter sp. HLT3-5]MCO4274270.1 hypothetical protein [Pseudarthrobacter sp. HLT3-5]